MNDLFAYEVLKQSLVEADDKVAALIYKNVKGPIRKILENAPPIFNNIDSPIPTIYIGIALEFMIYEVMSREEIEI